MTTSSILIALLLSSGQAVAEPAEYHVRVEGPLGTLDVQCDDPCIIKEIKRLENDGIPTTGTQSDDGKLEVTGSNVKRDKQRDYAAENIDCRGECGPGKAVSIELGQPKRKLQEGVEVRITNRFAHFIFYSVVEVEGGPATKKQHSEFRIDRPSIELELHGHDVELETRMDESERTDVYRRTIGD